MGTQLREGRRRPGSDVWMAKSAMVSADNQIVRTEQFHECFDCKMSLACETKSGGHDRPETFEHYLSLYLLYSCVGALSNFWGLLLSGTTNRTVKSARLCTLFRLA
eukprot:1694038-Amphidinium_carterae.1